MSRLEAIKQRLQLYKSDGLSEEEIDWLLGINADLLEACRAGLEALEAYLSDYETTNNPRPADNEPVVAQLVAAIKKATEEVLCK